MDGKGENLITEKKFYDWVNETHRNRIEKGRTRHPVMFSVRKYADDRIVEMYKTHTGMTNNSASIFYEDNVITPTSIDRIMYKFDQYYKISVIKSNELRESYKTNKNKLRENFYSPFIIKLDDLYQNSKKDLIELQNANANLKIISNVEDITSNSSKSFFKRTMSNLNKKLLSFNSNSVINYFGGPIDEYEKIFYEREKIFNKIRFKSFKNRFSGFWRTSLGIRKNYIIDLEADKAKSKHAEKYDSVPRKLFTIIRFKCFPNFRFTKSLFFKSAMVITLVFLMKIRYNSYDEVLTNEIKQNDKILDYVVDNSLGKVNKLSTIFDTDTENKYLLILRKDKELKKLTSEQFEKIEENSNEEFLSSYKFFLGAMHARSSIFNLIKLFAPLTYLIYKYKKGFKRGIFGNSLFIYFLLNELFLSLTFGDFVNLKNFTANYVLGGDLKEINRFNFYKNNLNNLYLIDDK